MDTRKYKNVILWGAKVIDIKLPTSFYEDINNYLKSYQKLSVQTWKDGNMVEKAADPILFSLYKCTLKWSIERNNIFIWFWTIVQWNYIAQCTSVDPLDFHNFLLGLDSLIVKYDDSKVDKDGERLSKKKYIPILRIIILTFGWD